MISVSSWFTTWMAKQELYLLRKLTYDDIHESTRWESFGSISRASDSIISGGTNIGVINSAQYWNKFLSDKSNLRKTATLQLAIGIENTIARAGIARAGITASNLYSLKAGSVVSSGIWVPRSEEWLDILTGWGDDPEFVDSYVSVAIRDKFAGLFEKRLGSDDSPVDYYSSAYNPADLAWDILVTYGGLDPTASTANTDIDYTAWSTWKTACTAVDLSLSGRLTGETIREAMELIRNLTNSDISVDGSGLVTFLRRAKGAASGTEQSFDTTNAADFNVKLDSSKIVNYLKVFYDYQSRVDIVTNGNMEADSSWTDMGSPTTNAQSNEQANGGIYSRKIISDSLFEGAYQDVATIIGREYTVRGYIYVTTGDAVLGAGSAQRYIGNSNKGSNGWTLEKDIVYGMQYTAPTTGTIASFRVYITEDCGGGPFGTAKCALYADDDGGSPPESVFIAETDEVALPDGTDGWVTFTFSTPPSVTAEAEYYLSIWMSEDDYGIYYDDADEFRWFRRDAEAYNGFPDPASWGSSSNHKRDYSIFGVYVDDDNWEISEVATAASWQNLSVTFIAKATSTRVFFESNGVYASTFYADDLYIEWTGPEYWPASYVKEDSTSQTNFGKAEPEVYQSTAIWHKTLASATTFADRRVAMFKDPLEIVEFTAFMEGQIAELGDIIKVTNAFFSYDDKYFRVYRIPEINLAAATIRIEAADFDDIS